MQLFKQLLKVMGIVPFLSLVNWPATDPITGESADPEMFRQFKGAGGGAVTPEWLEKNRTSGRNGERMVNVSMPEIGIVGEYTISERDRIIDAYNRATAEVGAYNVWRQKNTGNYNEALKASFNNFYGGGGGGSVEGAVNGGTQAHYGGGGGGGWDMPESKVGDVEDYWGGEGGMNWETMFENITSHLQERFDEQRKAYEDWQTTIDESFSKYEEFLTEEKMEEIVRPYEERIDKATKERIARANQRVKSANLDTRYLNETAIPEIEAEAERQKQEVRNPIITWQAEQKAMTPLRKSQAYAGMWGEKGEAYGDWMKTGLQTATTSIGSMLDRMGLGMTARGQDITRELGLGRLKLGYDELGFSKQKWGTEWPWKTDVYYPKEWGLREKEMKYKRDITESEGKGSFWENIINTITNIIPW